MAGPCGGFEGNAQSLRLLTRLEPKRFVTPRRPVSRRASASTSPAPRSTPPPSTPRRAAAAPPTRLRKFGVYPDDLPVFAWFRQGAPEHRRSFEAQVMDWSDDVAYS
ncbi:hypothetical protein GCM10020221_18470 [Streptomyces thioluteus]|uniref:Uncharacterized protein n=1 Tax=Streptomyces thioluteus TaxID=66431 RepID=A0ABN3WR88_STRTU